MAEKTVKPRIAIVTLALANIDYDAYGSHMAFMYRVGRECTEYDFIFLTPGRMAIDQARNACVEAAIINKCDAIFFYDDDTILHPHTMKKLLDQMFPEGAGSGPVWDILQPVYFIRGMPFPIMAFVADGEFGMAPMGDEIWQEEGPVVQCRALGNGCTLYNVELFKAVPHPWFLTRAGQHTEDIYFFSKVKAHKPDYKAGVVNTFSCGHLVHQTCIDSTNYKSLRAFSLLEKSENAELAEDVLKMIEARTAGQLNKMREDGKKNLLRSSKFYQGEPLEEETDGDDIFKETSGEGSSLERSESVSA